MSALAARLKLRLAEAALVSDPENNNGWGGRLGDLSTQLIGVGAIALIGTCIRVWAGMDVIQSQINTLVKSDSQQDDKIELVRTEVNNLRVQVGIIRAQMGAGPAGLGRP
jgi:uncharacterized membrane protein